MKTNFKIFIPLMATQFEFVDTNLELTLSRAERTLRVYDLIQHSVLVALLLFVGFPLSFS